jgi:CIC family chloride channel protein
LVLPFAVLMGAARRKINDIRNRSYLGKWLVVGLLIGLVAGLGAMVFFFYLIQLVTDTLLGGITGYYPPNPLGEP